MNFSDIGPYQIISGDECIGDSLARINANTVMTSSVDTKLFTEFASMSSYLITRYNSLSSYVKDVAILVGMPDTFTYDEQGRQQTIYAHLTSTVVSTLSSIPSLSPNLTGSTATFTSEISAPVVKGHHTGTFNGTFYGDATYLINVPSTSDPTKLPLAGGNLTGTVRGTNAYFLNQLSATTIRGNFYGDGSNLINVNDGTKLSIFGGSLQGSLKGTAAVFSVSLSSKDLLADSVYSDNMVGKFTGNGVGLYNVPGTPKAIVVFDGTLSIGTNQTMLTSYNVTNVLKNGTGDYTVNFTNPQPSSIYPVFCVASETSTGTTSNGCIVAPPAVDSYSTTSVRLISRTIANPNADMKRITVFVY